MELETGALLPHCVPELMRNGFPAGEALMRLREEKSLLQAVKDEDVDAVVRLHLAKADLNQRVDAGGRTCLHYAVQQNKLRLIRVLTALGVDLAIQDNDGFSAVHRAVCVRSRSACCSFSKAACLLLLLLFVVCCMLFVVF